MYAGFASAVRECTQTRKHVCSPTRRFGIGVQLPDLGISPEEDATGAHTHDLSILDPAHYASCQMHADGSMCVHLHALTRPASAPQMQESMHGRRMSNSDDEPPAALRHVSGRKTQSGGNCTTGRHGTRSCWQRWPSSRVSSSAPTAGRRRWRATWPTSCRTAARRTSVTRSRPCCCRWYAGYGPPSARAGGGSSCAPPARGRRCQCTAS